MSVRRLAEAQPESFSFSKASEEKIAFWIKKYPADRKASAVIPLLWLAQKQEGWVSEPAIREIGARLDMPFIRVYEVATFYTMFNLTPVGQHLIQVCGTTPCWLRGSDALKAVCESRIGKKGRENISPDGKFSWEEVECLGSCSNAPMVQISSADGDYYYEDLSGADLERLLDDLAAGKPVNQGPVTGRHCSEPVKAKSPVLVDEALFDGSRAAPIAVLPNARGLAAPAQPAAATPAVEASAKPKQTKPKPTSKKPSNAKAASRDAVAGDTGTAAEKAPPVLKAAKGKADDLKRLSGVGPKLEQLLNSMGIFHFSQIAAWGPQEIAWVDARLKFKGRIEREGWVAQARTLSEDKS